MRYTAILITILAAASLAACASTSTPSPIPLVESASSKTTATSAQPLLFTIGMHIEPQGTTAQQASKPGAGGTTRQGPDYNDVRSFERAVNDIQTVVDIVERHGGRMTIQSQSPFTTTAVKTGNSILGDLEDAGHEVGLHFHEEPHMGRNANTLTPDRWCTVLKEEITYIHQAGVEDVEYWSGGNLYPQMYEAAACAGLSVNSDWKNPNLQSTPLELTGTVPWRPAGGTDGVDLTAFAKHDPDGKIVFLPEGKYAREDFASMRRSETAGGDEAYFQFLKESLLASIEGAEPGKVNVFHFTVHPGEFHGSPTDPFGVIERFLTEVVDPLVAQGKIQWATLSEMAAAYEQWEQAR